MMSDVLGKKCFPKKETKHICVVPYDPNWPDLFEKEAIKIKEVLMANFVAIHHVGSTAVPGLLAKPVIDIIGVVKSPEEAIVPLESLGFSYKGEYNIPNRYYFNRSEGINTNLHLYGEGHPEIELNLLFRNYLRSHPEERNQYAALKEELLKDESSYEKKGSVFTGYNLGKDAFIRKILQAAHFDRMRIMKCTHYAEWDEAKRLRSKCFFESLSVADPNTWTFDDPEHVHIILYLGVTIIGYAHVQWITNTSAMIRMMVIHENYRGQSLGSQFLHDLEIWLKKQKIECVYGQAWPHMIAFYKKNSYSEMFFKDPLEQQPISYGFAMGKKMIKP